MSERKLEPTPGWCERAYELLRDVQFYRYLPNEHDALMKRGSELMRQSDKAGVSDNEWRAAALDKMNARFKRYVENELKPESPPQNDVSYDGYCVSCHGFYVASTGGGTCPVCEARVRPGLKIASDTLLLKDLPMPTDHEIISLWEKQIAEENQRSRDAGEQHPNIGEEFIQAVQLARKYYKMTVVASNATYDPWADVVASGGIGIEHEGTYPNFNPKPAPLPHEWEKGDTFPPSVVCGKCGLQSFQPMLDERPCEPPAEKAEALPDALKLWASWMEETFVPQHIDHVVRNVLLAECRKIAREELSKARVERKVDGHFENEWTAEGLHRCIGADLRIVPGKEGE